MKKLILFLLGYSLQSLDAYHGQSTAILKSAFFTSRKNLARSIVTSLKSAVEDQEEQYCRTTATDTPVVTDNVVITKNIVNTLFDDVRITNASILERKCLNNTIPLGDNLSVGIPPPFSSVVAATALVAGTTIGAGVLALPSTSFAPGFIPSTSMLIATWAYMCTTGLLLAEMSCNLVSYDPVGMCMFEPGAAECKSPGVLSMIETTLGKEARAFSGLVYIFIHYTLLVAYIAQAGGILSNIFNLTNDLGPLIFTGIMASIMIGGSSKIVESVNNALVAVVFASFISLATIGLPSVDVANLLHQDSTVVLRAVPVMIVALVYHNVVPTICTQLSYHKESVSKAITIGSFLPLCLLVLWNLVILGSIGDGAVTEGADFNPLAWLQSKEGGNGIISPVITVFCASAIITSFIGVTIGLVDFLVDALPDPTGGRTNRDLDVNALVVVPPMVIATAYPDIFEEALGYTGAFGNTVLFGALPALMAFRLRYGPEFECMKQSEQAGAFKYQTFVGGGKPLLAGLVVVTLLVIAQKAVSLWAL